MTFLRQKFVILQKQSKNCFSLFLFIDVANGFAVVVRIGNKYKIKFLSYSIKMALLLFLSLLVFVFESSVCVCVCVSVGEGRLNIYVYKATTTSASSSGVIRTGARAFLGESRNVTCTTWTWMTNWASSLPIPPFFSPLLSFAFL